MGGKTKRCIPEITVAQDMMTAQLRLKLDEGGQELDVSDIKELLAGRNVKTGINEATIEEMIEQELYDISVQIAEGKAPVKGKDGYFIYHVTPPEEQQGPKVLEDGSVEYVKTTEYTIVEPDQLLAEYVHATGGEYGYTLDNAMRSPVRGKELSVLRGKGFRIEEDKYYSNIHGRFEMMEKGFQITNLLEVKGDVDISYGHINFDGDVNIRGDVKSGMMVKATGTIEIKGHVGNSYVEAGKDIILGNGMQGKFTGKLKAAGNIQCKFFENTQAIAGGDITLRTTMNSRLEAGGRVIVEGRDAVVLGGSVYAVQGMDIAEAGNESEISTTLAAGALPATYRREVELRKLIEKVEGEVDLLDRSAKIFNRMVKTNVTKETENRRMKVIQAKVIKSTELKQYEEEQKRVKALIENGKRASITIQNTIYPGCHVDITGTGIEVKQSLKHVKFVLNDGRIEASLLY